MASNMFNKSNNICSEIYDKQTKFWQLAAQKNNSHATWSNMHSSKWIKSGFTIWYVGLVIAYISAASSKQLELNLIFKKVFCLYWQDGTVHMSVKHSQILWSIVHNNKKPWRWKTVKFYKTIKWWKCVSLWFRVPLYSVVNA